MNPHAIIIYTLLSFIVAGVMLVLVWAIKRIEKSQVGKNQAEARNQLISAVIKAANTAVNAVNQTSKERLLRIAKQASADGRLDASDLRMLKEEAIDFGVTILGPIAKELGEDIRAVMSVHVEAEIAKSKQNE